MSLFALTRSPGPELAQCELTHLERQPIDFTLALAQHRSYQQALRAQGIRVIELPADSAHPDGVFVEDTAVLLDKMAIVTSPTPPSRRGERTAVVEALKSLRPMQFLPENVRLEGGDVLRMGHMFFVGLSSRTNAAGIHALAELVRPFGYSVNPVHVRGCLHLKSACTALDAGTLLINQSWVDAEPFARLRLVEVPAGEPWGANVLALPGTVFVSNAHHCTAALLDRMGYPITVLDVSELHKAESGLTCMSLIGRDSTGP